MPSKANITLYRGDDETRVIRLTTTDGAPFDLSQIARVDLHARADDQPEPVLRLSSETGEILALNPTLGELRVNFAHPLTARADWLEAQFDLQLTSQSGQIKTVLAGKIKLTHDITQTEA